MDKGSRDASLPTASGQGVAGEVPENLWTALPGVAWAPDFLGSLQRRAAQLGPEIAAGLPARRAVWRLLREGFLPLGLNGCLQLMVTIGWIERCAAAALAADLGEPPWPRAGAPEGWGDEPRSDLPLGEPDQLPAVLWSSPRLAVHRDAWCAATAQAAAGRAARKVLRLVAALCDLGYEDVLWGLVDSGECSPEEVAACLAADES